ncbi:predicted protein [Histoplasma capsulatum H143]|uniref:Uncharacterized protein n=1 Tax=Ajellomyces capsulatus (strain H143) TaxID=544712 RepID=C6H8U8_AJECH|nr:predicted protein [Histoplasma capsulatum H143]
MPGSGGAGGREVVAGRKTANFLSDSSKKGNGVKTQAQGSGKHKHGVNELCLEEKRGPRDWGPRERDDDGGEEGEEGEEGMEAEEGRRRSGEVLYQENLYSVDIYAVTGGFGGNSLIQQSMAGRRRCSSSSSSSSGSGYGYSYSTPSCNSRTSTTSISRRLYISISISISRIAR